MSEIAVLNASKLDDGDVAFAVEACDIQLREHVCPVWLGLEYTPVRFYASPKDLPVVGDICRLMVLSDTLDVPGALGYHTMDPLVRGVVLAGAGFEATLSHECIEELGDPTADAWVPMPDGRRVALELCDPVEGDSYELAATLLGATRTVLVSSFVYPAWFGTGAGKLDHMDRAPAPFTLAGGGYMIVLDGDGQVHDVWAASAPARRARKVLNSTSRSYRRGVR
jgi:hypothetical protein